MTDAKRRALHVSNPDVLLEVIPGCTKILTPKNLLYLGPAESDLFTKAKTSEFPLVAMLSNSAGAARNPVR